MIWKSSVRDETLRRYNEQRVAEGQPEVAQLSRQVNHAVDVILDALREEIENNNGNIIIANRND